MREKDIHNLIEQQDPESKQRIWEKISAQIDVTPATSPKPVPKKKIGMWSAIAAVLVCIVTLSIVLPITLRGEDEPSFRYCETTQYTTAEFNQTLKEYSLSHDNKLRYIDWYNIAEEINVVYGHMIGDTNDIVFIKEYIFNGETGEEVILFVTDNKTRVEGFESRYAGHDELIVKSVTVRYGHSATRFLAMFEYDNYIYYMQLDTTDGLERFTNIIEDMLK